MCHSESQFIVQRNSCDLEGAEWTTHLPILSTCLSLNHRQCLLLGKKKATHLENRIQRSFSSKPSQLCLWRINKNIDDTMNIVLLLLSALLLQTRQWKWQLVVLWKKNGCKKRFSFLDLYSFKLWNCPGSGFGSHLWIFPFASNIPKHNSVIVIQSFLWCEILSAAATLSLWIEMKPFPWEGEPTCHWGKETDIQTTAGDNTPVGICELRK